MQNFINLKSMEGFWDRVITQIGNIANLIHKHRCVISKHAVMAYLNGVYWVLYHLFKTHILEKSNKKYKIDQIKLKFIKQNSYKEINSLKYESFRKLDKQQINNINIHKIDILPEIIKNNFAPITNKLNYKLLAIILNIKELKFGKLTLNLLYKMKYKYKVKSIYNIPKTNNSGINTGKLSFSNIQIQTKNWKCDRKFFKAKLQKFIVALSIQAPTDNIFAIASKFAKEVGRYTKNAIINNINLILINRIRFIKQ